MVSARGDPGEGGARACVVPTFQPRPHPGGRPIPVMKTLSERRRDLGKDYIRSEKQIKKAKRGSRQSSHFWERCASSLCCRRFWTCCACRRAFFSGDCVFFLVLLCRGRVILAAPAAQSVVTQGAVESEASMSSEHGEAGAAGWCSDSSI